MGWLIGRAAAAHISGEEAEALSCAAGGGGGDDSAEAEGEGGGGGEGHAPERRVGGTSGAA